MKKYLPLLPILALAACGGMSQITPDMEIATENRLPDIDPRGGQLCIFRASNFIGGGASCEINANNEYIGRLPNSSFFCINLMPDEYTLTGRCFGGARFGAETIIRQGQRRFMELQVASTGVQLISHTRETALGGLYDAMK